MTTRISTEYHMKIKETQTQINVTADQLIHDPPITSDVDYHAISVSFVVLIRVQTLHDRLNRLRLIQAY